METRDTSEFSFFYPKQREWRKEIQQQTSFGVTLIGPVSRKYLDWPSFLDLYIFVENHIFC